MSYAALHLVLVIVISTQESRDAKLTKCDVDCD